MDSDRDQVSRCLATILVDPNHGAAIIVNTEADLLRYTRDFNLAVVEAKTTYKSASDAVQQARADAERPS